jgi:hypothetical protein
MKKILLKLKGQQKMSIPLNEFQEIVILLLKRKILLAKK